MVIMDTYSSIFYLKQPKSRTIITVPPAETAAHTRVSNTHTPGQTAGMTPTTQTLQWLA